MATPDFDVVEAHKHFSVNCFNLTWDFIDQPSRTLEENEQMILTSMASVWHWTQRPDCEPKNLSIGYWQLSRVFALAGQAEQARKYGEISLRHGKNEAPFYIGYAYEALARAEAVGGNKAKMNEYLTKAREYLAKVTDADGRKVLQADLETIQ